jgi:hypothetical protein
MCLVVYARTASASLFFFREATKGYMSMLAVTLLDWSFFENHVNQP